MEKVKPGEAPGLEFVWSSRRTPWLSEESGLGQEWDGGSPRGFWEYFTKLNGDQNIAHRKTTQDI